MSTLSLGPTGRDSTPYTLFHHSETTFIDGIIISGPGSPFHSLKYIRRSTSTLRMWTSTNRVLETGSSVSVTGMGRDRDRLLVGRSSSLPSFLRRVRGGKEEKTDCRG